MLEINNSEKWSYDLFEGFSVSNSSWEIAGHYVVEASHEKEFRINPNSFQSTIDRRQFTLPFSIYVEGIWITFYMIKKNLYLFIVIKGIEIIPSARQAIQGKYFSLRCRFKFPLHISTRPTINSLNWYWTSHENQLAEYENVSLHLGNLTFHYLKIWDI